MNPIITASLSTPYPVKSEIITNVRPISYLADIFSFLGSLGGLEDYSLFVSVFKKGVGAVDLKAGVKVGVKGVKSDLEEDGTEDWKSIFFP